MKTKSIIFSALIFSSSIIAYSLKVKNEMESNNIHTALTYKSNESQSYISIFTIPATDITRAIEFYQALLDIKIEKMEFPGMEMGILPYEGQVVTGVILKGEGYNPSTDGITNYLNAGDNLQFMLDKVEQNGGKVLVPKTPHADENGYFAMILDTEGNKLGLHSPN